MTIGGLRQYTAAMTRTRLFLAIAACLVCLSAQAQWQWIDKDGRRVFSDRAPPPDVPPKSILKQPGAAPGSTAAPVAARAAVPAGAASAAAAAASAAAPSVAAPTLSGVDKELTDKKKQAEAAIAAQARADEERVRKAKADNCERAKANKTLMDSGVRVSRTGASGEREILDDAARAAELKRIQAVMDANCR